MQDRVPVNPGRVLITPENGVAPYYATMTRADNPTQNGTPLNKASLLKDATAALFGLGTNAVPDDVLNVLSRFQNGLGNEYVWAKTTQDVLKGTKTSITLGTNMVNNTIEYSSSVSVDPFSGAIQLVNPSSVSTHALKSGSTKLSGMYFRFPNGYSSYASTTIYYSSATSTVLYVNSVYSIDAQPCTGLVIPAGYVNSPDANAYPPTVSDGYTYMALGQLGANMTKIATGSYKGTGLVGPSNPCVVNLDFAPKFGLVFMDVFPKQGSYGWKAGGFAWAAPIAKDSIDYSTNADLYKLHFTFTEGTFKFNLGGEQGNYANTLGGGAADYQCNTSGKTYNYIFVG